MNPSKRLNAPLVAFGLAALVALAYAIYTQHAWEDYYITYRSSKNLATGHGLVFNLGDRLHTFTSPLGVLLPALASLLTGNSSDPAALWIFRGMCIAALAGGVALCVRLLQQLRCAAAAIVFTVGCLVFDAKTVDFTINGMETAFMVLFLVYALWSHLTPGPRQWLHLGGAWAGLMWTRPDSFIYIGLIAAGCWLFQSPAEGGSSRRSMLVLFARAGAVTTAIYLPWLLFTHFYYGTIIPHTITAKSGVGEPHSLAGFLNSTLHLFISGWTDGTLRATFLPAYYLIGGWPEKLLQLAGVPGTLCAILWLLPFVRPVTRVCSFAYFGAHAYLSYFPYFPFPWYLPSTALLGIITLGTMLAQVLAGARRWAAHEPEHTGPRYVARTALGVAALLVATSGWLTWQTARQFQAQQRYIEEGTRRKIGEWLRANARPGEAVFLEPLGYIGFYSGMKTYDFPGMSSREMVAARKLVANDWLPLIEFLQPTWLVLRAHEAAGLQRRAPALLSENYAPVQEFSVLDQIRKLDVMGRRYLEHDAAFTVYRLQRPIMQKSRIAEAHSQFDVSLRVVEGHELNMVHATGYMVVKVPPHARVFQLRYGYPPDAYTGTPPLTDGAIFQVDWQLGERTVNLLNISIDPVNNPNHRQLQTLTATLPETGVEGARLVLRTLAGVTTIKDWTCWSTPEFDRMQ